MQNALCHYRSDESTCSLSSVTSALVVFLLWQDKLSANFSFSDKPKGLEKWANLTNFFIFGWTVQLLLHGVDNGVVQFELRARKLPFEPILSICMQTKTSQFAAKTFYSWLSAPNLSCACWTFALRTWSVLILSLICATDPKGNHCLDRQYQKGILDMVTFFVTTIHFYSYWKYVA